MALSPRGQKYAIVTIGTVILQGNDIGIKCELCGTILTGETQQDQIGKLFECLATHIPAKDLYEIYEQKGGKILTQINREAWEKAKKSTKHKQSRPKPILVERRKKAK